MTRFLRFRIETATLLGGIGLTLLLTGKDANAQGWCCFNKNTAPAYPVGPPIPITPTAPSGTAMTSNFGSYGMQPPSPGAFFPAGLPQTSAGMLPTAAYDTRWVQTPVTYYRPVTQFDPRYGTTVTSLQPCTSYQYQAARVPLVAPQLVPQPTYSANRLPAVTAPGYYPTALAPANVYPTLQQIPSAGTPVTSGMMSYATAGTSSGPASTLPLATMSSPSSVAPATFFNPSVGSGVSQATAFMPATQSPMATAPMSSVPMSSVPITSAIPGTGTPVYSVPNPSMTNCPNGVCNPSTVPSIPGATSVVPLGPPTTLPSTAAAMNPTLANPSLANPPAANTTTVPWTNPSAPSAFAPNPAISNPVMPNPGDINPVLPPGSGSDPEATRQPSLGTSAAMFPQKRIPVSEMDRAPMVPTGSDNTAARLSVPPVLPPSTLQPLKAPSDFDAKPRWNPKLLLPSGNNKDETVASTMNVRWVTV
ncbi:MAG: hypothetical protein MUF23_02540 [Pirellula sp.]|nr:hypothetical protein [Pirellula sp.]